MKKRIVTRQSLFLLKEKKMSRKGVLTVNLCNNLT